MLTCSSCGQENPDGFKFCGACAAALVPGAPKREVRKTVTAVFTDISGSTALGERLDPEALRKTMASYFEEIRRIIERHGGTVEKFIGDAAMAVFGIPVAQEDDALRAVRAVVEIRERLTQLDQERSLTLSFRTGVNTGQVVAGEGETIATGDAVNVAARLEQAAVPGEILIGADTLALVRDAVSVEPVEPLQLKGKQERVPAYRLLSVDLGAPAIARHPETPLVGRVREMKRLLGAFEDVVSERTCHLFTILGPAGVGKSRLVAEFLANVGDEADVLRGRCLHYGDDISYWPLVEILMAVDVEPDQVIGASPAETQLAFRRLLEARAPERPQIVVFEDIQWAEPVFLDLIEHIADWSRDAPILLLCVARRELLELREGWGGGKGNATTISLESLAGEDCEVLLKHLAEGLALSEDLHRRILATAGGNPLFIEEMIAVVADGNGHGDVTVPPTIQALLQARLDGLGSDERDVIGRGAVEGQVFHGGAVAELSPQLGPAGVPAQLQSLVRKDLIRPERAQLQDQEAFRFRHLLIRDAAYDSLPKEIRSELHERFATWLEHQSGVVEMDEIVGYHLEQSHRNRAELDAEDPRLGELARRAATRLNAAGKGAHTRGDWNAAMGLYERSVALLPEGDSQRLEALIQIVVLLNTRGRFHDARAVAAELGASDDPRFRAFADVIWSMTDIYTGEHDSERSLGRIEGSRSVFETLGDELGLAWCEMYHENLAWQSCRAEVSTEAAGRALAHAVAAGDAVLANGMRSSLVDALIFGPAHIDEAIRAAESMLANAKGHLVEVANVNEFLGKALAIRGETDKARELVNSAIEVFRESGLELWAVLSCMTTWLVEVAAGNMEAAERSLREGAAELDRVGDRSHYATVLLLLAGVLEQRGEYDEAARLCAEIRETTPPDDLLNVFGVDGLEGYLLARAGDLEGGERLARRAVELVANIDFYHRANAYEMLARTVSLAGKHTEAREAADVALAIYEAKGDRAATERARSLVASFSGSAR